MTSNSTPGHLPKRNENMSHKDSNASAHNSFIHKSPKLKTAQVSINKRMEKQTQETW